MVLATACRALVSNLWGVVISQELIITDGICRARDEVLTRDDATDSTQENFLDVFTVDNTDIDRQDSVITVLLKNLSFTLETFSNQSNDSFSTNRVILSMIAFNFNPHHDV